jgi:hypothetical protein
MKTAEILCAEKQQLFKDASLSANTVAKHVEGLAGDIEYQLKSAKTLWRVELQLTTAQMLQSIHCAAAVFMRGVYQELSELVLMEETGQALYTQAHSSNHCCRGKAISITYSECVSIASVTQHAKRMGRIVLSSVACLAVRYFPTLSHKGRIFGKKLLNTKYALINLILYIKRAFSFSLQLMSEAFLILRTIQRDIIINVRRSSCEVPVILVRF